MAQRRMPIGDGLGDKERERRDDRGVDGLGRRALSVLGMRLPHRSQHGAEHDDAADEGKLCQETEDHADRAVGVAVRGHDRREVER
jgi:hypothetical protein